MKLMYEIQHCIGCNIKINVCESLKYITLIKDHVKKIYDTFNMFCTLRKKKNFIR